MKEGAMYLTDSGIEPGSQLITQRIDNSRNLREILNNRCDSRDTVVFDFKIAKMKLYSTLYILIIILNVLYIKDVFCKCNPLNRRTYQRFLNLYALYVGLYCMCSFVMVLLSRPVSAVSSTCSRKLQGRIGCVKDNAAFCPSPSNWKTQ